MTYDVTAPSDVAQPVGLILHLGAGTGEALDSYLESQATQIVLVEPEPERAEGLRDLVSGLSEQDQDRIQVLELAVAMADGTAMLTVFNQVDASSLLPPTGLRDLYPGLRTLGRAEVATVSPASLLDKLTLGPDAFDWLVVDTPGLEAQILRVFAELGALGQFSRIDLRCGVEPLYEGSVPGAAILRWLGEEGYLPGPSPDDADPDQCERRLMRNPALPRIRVVEAECAELQGQLTKLEAALDASLQERAAEKQQTEAAQAEQEQRLTTALEEKGKALEASEYAHKAQVENLVAEKTALSEKLSQAEAAAVTQAEHLVAENTALSDKLSQAEAAAAVQAEQEQHLTAALEEKSKALEASEHARKAQVEQAEHLVAENASLSEKLSQADAAAAAQAEQEQHLSAALEEKSKALETSVQARKIQIEQAEQLVAETAALSEKLSQTEAAAAAQAEQEQHLTAALEEKSKALGASEQAHKAQVAQLSAQKDALNAQVNELTEKLAEASLVTKADLAAAHAERDALRKDLEDTKIALVTSQSHQAQLAQSRDDIVRAEGQIALIKDLLLSGPEL